MIKKQNLIVLALSLTVLFQPFHIAAQTTPKPDPFASIKILLGTWNATTGAGTAQAKAIGTYTFRLDLAGTVVTRISSADTCSGPAAYDCQHQDSLTIFEDQGDPALHAIYFDSEGHTIHYNLTTPDTNTVVFLSNTPGPQFRLTYHREGNTMTGKFQIAPPGSSTFTSYLEWSGTKS